MLKKFVLFFIITLSGCLPSHIQTNPGNCNQENNIPSENSPISVQNEFGIPIMWNRDAFPIRVITDPNMRTERKSMVREAISTWNRQVGLEVFFYYEGPQTYEEGTIWVNEEQLPLSECGDQFFGLARRFFDVNILGIRTTIIRATIRLHIGVPINQILSTIIHELGHALGLHHSRNTNSVMYPYNTPERGGITEEMTEYVRKMMVG